MPIFTLGAGPNQEHLIPQGSFKTGICPPLEIGSWNQKIVGN